MLKEKVLEETELDCEEEEEECQGEENTRNRAGDKDNQRELEKRRNRRK
jgi:hypothetical protein